MANRVKYQADRYYDYQEITDLLKGWEASHPQFMGISSIGKSFEGRDIWMATLTNRETGDAHGKPGFWIDANIHAGEVTGSAVALYTIWYLLDNYGKDEKVTMLLDTRTFYVVPRISVDGGEVYMHSPDIPRSSIRPYPDDLELDEGDGLVPQDINGDGEITQMRVKDPNGEWKVSESDSRLMIRRQPDDFGGIYYRLYREGIVQGYDGGAVKPAKPRWGLDINRNFPANWLPEGKQPGAGPYPLSEPETRALAETLVNTGNIGGAMAYHTTGGVILRPFCSKVDDKMDNGDLAAFKAIGRRGTELTGYPCESVYEGFTNRQALHGVFLEWLYEHYGILTYSTELWSLRDQAGLDRKSVKEMIEMDDKDREEEGLKLLKWNDEVLAGKGFMGWQPADHPELGAVEIGGWYPKFVLQNPPTKLLQEECHKNMLFTLVHALALPGLEISDTTVKEIATLPNEMNVVKLTATVENNGYLPTNVSAQAIKQKVAKPVKVRLDLPEGAEMVMGKAEQDIGHLEGRARSSYGYYYASSSSGSKQRVEWVARVPATTKTLRITAHTERAGSTTLDIDI